MWSLFKIKLINKFITIYNDVRTFMLIYTYIYKLIINVTLENNEINEINDCYFWFTPD